MADVTPPLELSGEQRAVASRLTLAMKGVAGVLLLLGVVSAVGGAVALSAGSGWGVLGLLEGVVTVLLGLIMLSSSTDIRYLADTKYAAIHMGNAFQNLTNFYQAQFGLAAFLAIVALIRLFVG